MMIKVVMKRKRIMLSILGKTLIFDKSLLSSSFPTYLNFYNIKIFINHSEKKGSEY